MVTKVKQPRECTEAELGSFCTLVREGEEVAPATLDDLVRAAEALAFLEHGGAVVGVAGLKKPNIGYKERVFKAAGLAAQARRYALELGWVFVAAAHRGNGLSRELAEAAMSRAGSAAVFATTRVDNVPMQRTLERIGFARGGSPWRSRRGAHQLALYLRVATAS